MNLYKLSIVCLALMLAACSPSKDPSSKSTKSSSTYRFAALVGTVNTLDPSYTDFSAEARLISDLFETLVIQDENGAMLPGVALSWSANSDFTVWTFNLRKDAKWSNGDPVTAHDFVYAWQRAVELGAANPYDWYWELVQIANTSEILAGTMASDQLGVEAISNYQLQVTLERGLAFLPKMLVHTIFSPLHQATIELHGSDWTLPDYIVGNGAYVLTAQTVDQVTLAVNEHYRTAENLYMTQIEAVFYETESQSISDFESGYLDQALVPYGQFVSLNQKFPGEVLSVPRLCNYYYQFNFADTAMQDADVRKALVYTVDRSFIVNDVLQGGQFEAYSFTPEYVDGFIAPDLDWASWTQEERNVAAQALMAGAGYDESNKLNLEIFFNTSSGHQSIAEAIKADWEANLPVTVTTRHTTWNDFLSQRGSGNYQIARGAWCGDYNEPSTFLHLLTTNSEYNDLSFSDGTYDSLVNDGMVTQGSSALYTQAEQLLSEQSVIIPIYHYNAVLLLQDDVLGYPMNNVEQNVYSKDLYR